jgi:hypothetical protein
MTRTEEGKRVAADEILGMVHRCRDLSRPRVCSAGGTSEKQRQQNCHQWQGPETTFPRVVQQPA